MSTPIARTAPAPTTPSANGNAARPGGSGHTAVVAVTLVTLLAASTAPTPLYRLYQESWAFSPALLTAIFGVYALSLLGTLLTAGALSDHIGRKPVILGALAVQAAAMGLFLAADGPGWLIAARVVQGLSVGAATAALGAALIDINRVKGPTVNSVAPLVGMGVGALGTSALAAYAPAPMHLVFALLLAAFAVEAVLIARLPETAAVRPGALASLRPRVRVPRHVRSAMLRVSPVNVAVWALGGFFMSLVPSLMRAATGSPSTLLGGAVVSTLTLSGAAAILLLRERPAAAALALGRACLVTGVLAILAGVHLGQAAVLFAATVVAGFGFGAGFVGSVRTLVPLAEADERAGLLAAIYIQGYLAFCLPAMGAGLLAQRIGLLPATDLYAVALVVLVLASMVRRRRRVSPCPQEGG